MVCVVYGECLPCRQECQGGGGRGAQETGCSWAWSCGAVAQARAATRQLFAARRQLVDLCSNFSHCATCCAIWSPRAFEAAPAAAAVADDVAVAAPSTMMVAPIAFCKVLAARHKSPLPSAPLPLPRLIPCCPLGLLPRILSIFHMSLYGRIYRSMRLIATRFCLVAADKCNSHSNWTCTFMAFSFSFPLPHTPLPQHTPHTLSFPSLSFARVQHTKPQENAKEKRHVNVSVCVCVCRLPPSFRRSVSKKVSQVPKLRPKREEKQQGSNTLMEFVPCCLSRGKQ